MSSRRPPAPAAWRVWLAAILKRYSIWWGIVTCVLYFLAIPFTILVFPSTTLILTVVVLFGGFTGSVFAVAQILGSADTDARLAEIERRLTR